MYGMNTRGLPGTLAPIYQELQVDRIDFEHMNLGPNASRRDRLDRLAADVDQGDIWAVIGPPVAGIDAEPLAADDVARREHLSDLRIVHDLSDLAANKLGREVIGR